VIGRLPKNRSNTAQTKNKERRHDITRFNNLAYVPRQKREIHRGLTNKYEEYNLLSLTQDQLGTQQWVTSPLFIVKWREKVKRGEVGSPVHSQN